MTAKPRQPAASPGDHPLELDGAELREALRVVGRKLGAFLDSLPEQPAMKLDGSHRLARSLMKPPPEEGRALRGVVAQLVDHISPTSLNTAGPGYLAFIPGGGLPMSAVADLVGGVLNRYTGLWMPAPGLVQAEIAVLHWLCEVVGYGTPGPDNPAGGQLTSGGSLANLCAVVAARETTNDFRDGVIYCSALVHHSVLKAARTAGFRPDQVRTSGMDEHFRLDVAQLGAVMESDAHRGRRPLMVVASAGTTAVGSVDPLRELADFCRPWKIWLHVDAAYGGCFALTGRGRAVLDGLGEADSVTLDPHKGLFLPYGTGALLVKDRARLQAAFRVHADYLPDPVDGQEFWDFADLGPELSRPARGLRLWLPLQVHGVAAFREALDEKLDLTQRALEGVRALPHVRIVCEPELSLFAFRVEPPGMSPEEVDDLCRRITARVNQARRVHITGATVPVMGAWRFVIRVCVLSFRTHAEHIDAFLEDLAAAIADPRG